MKLSRKRYEKIMSVYVVQRDRIYLTSTPDILANVILGERMPWDIVNKRTEEVVLEAGQLITWRIIKQMVASGDDYVIKSGKASLLHEAYMEHKDGRVLLPKKRTNWGVAFASETLGHQRIKWK